MSKRELIDAILKHNRTAAPEFLAKFAERDLQAYLERMSLIMGGRQQKAVWAGVDHHEALVVA